MANEKRLIDAEKFLQWLVKRFKCVPLIGSCDNDSESVKLLLAQAPTVDAEEVVRCKDCRHWDEYHEGSLDGPGTGMGVCLEGSNWIDGKRADDFCSCGERRNEE